MSQARSKTKGAFPAAPERGPLPSSESYVSTDSDGFATHPPTPQDAQTPAMERGMQEMSLNEGSGAVRNGVYTDDEAEEARSTMGPSPGLGGQGEGTGGGARIQRTDAPHHRIESMRPGQ